MSSKYNFDSVNKAIENSKSPISKQESRLIHALLKGHEKDISDNEKETK